MCTKRELLDRLGGRVSPDVVQTVSLRLRSYADSARISIEEGLSATQGFAEAQDIVLEADPSPHDPADYMEG